MAHVIEINEAADRKMIAALEQQAQKLKKEAAALSELGGSAGGQWMGSAAKAFSGKTSGMAEELGKLAASYTRMAEDARIHLAQLQKAAMQDVDIYR